MILGPKNESVDKQHRFCPKTADSWCRYQRDQTNGTVNYDRRKCIPYIFRNELKSIFDRLSSQDMLKSCQGGLTQNQNESINSVVWSRCPKRLFCGLHRYTISVCDAVSQFNDGSNGRYHLFKTLNVDVGDNARRELFREHTIRLSKAAAKVTAKSIYYCASRGKQKKKIKPIYQEVLQLKQCLI